MTDQPRSREAPAVDAVLTAADLRAITGTRVREQQAAVLQAARIYHWRRLDGSICTTWHHVHHPMLAAPTTDTEQSRPRPRYLERA